MQHCMLMTCCSPIAKTSCWCLESLHFSKYKQGEKQQWTKLFLHNRRNLAEWTEYLVVRLACGLAMHTMPKLGYADTPSIIIAACYCAQWRMGIRWQLAFNSLVVMFSFMLLPDLWHRRNYRAEKRSVVASLVFAWLWNACNGRQVEQITP